MEGEGNQVPMVVAIEGGHHPQSEGSFSKKRLQSPPRGGLKIVFAFRLVTMYFPSLMTAPTKPLDETKATGTSD
jgi:hypothetical protein